MVDNDGAAEVVTKLWLKRVKNALYPDSVEAQEVFERLPQGKALFCEVKQPRSASHNRLYWALLHRVAKWLDQENVDADVLHEFYKLKAGLVVIWKTPSGEIRTEPASTAFHRLDQVKFNEFFEKVVRITYADLQVPPALIADLLVPEEKHEPRR